jgi:MFS-type transporter involved in bile tolerance (Atg22 family)
MGALVVGNDREISGWAMYDWANSAFSTTVVTAFLGPFLAALIAGRSEGMLPVLLTTDVRRAIAEAGNEIPELV